MSVDQFINTCKRGDEAEARSLFKQNEAIHNKQNSEGFTGLMESLGSDHHNLSRWLLSLPGLDTNLTNRFVIGNCIRSTTLLSSAGTTGRQCTTPAGTTPRWTSRSS